MSIDRSLKLKDSLKRHRNVLSRGERIEILKKEERWEEGKVMGLPKVVHRKSSVGKKAAVKKETAEGQETAASAAPSAAGSK
ncbi:MAG TPA: small basic protein [Anaerohalosphaeraceae bacterium]|jgi:small basic protein (TIGR04137 family)|nr:small basic protein [Phycisphaerae bacterium]HOT71985.1 small basic protein [Anaerohalosphaeraceae bacterium]HQG05213.1 small basic protein [Anaerohalosphaeraceae bacterium]HQI06931.1 small basic protein [Anaerohalosphaeraceae bacterium]HQJ66627.1 small basic protein [Anaerohalosphaeraceae bacterium]